VGTSQKTLVTNSVKVPVKGNDGCYARKLAGAILLRHLTGAVIDNSKIDTSSTKEEAPELGPLCGRYSRSLPWNARSPIRLASPIRIRHKRSVAL